MVQINDNKLYPKNWVTGDTFALKIESDDKECDGRYFIITKFYMDTWDGDWDKYKTQVFRVKITNDKTLPTTEEEINKLDYVKTEEIPYILRNAFHTNGNKTYDMVEKENKDLKFYPDEYGYIYYYHFVLFCGKRKIKNFIYLGNFNIKPPEKDSHIFEPSLRVPLCWDDDYNNIIKKLLFNYQRNNLKQDKIYTEEGCKDYIRKAKEELELHKQFLNKTYFP